MADDTSYDKAIQRRAEILKELRDLEEYIELYQRLFVANAARPMAVGTQGEGAAPKIRNRNILPPKRMADLAYEIITESGHPMTRGELAKAIEARGIPLTAADKAKNVGTILWRFQDRFINVPGRGYWPIDRPFPDP